MWLRERALIPTLILFGFVFGRWWRLALVLATLGWPALLLATGVIDSGGEFVAAAALALVNTLAGVLPHQAALWSIRRLRAASNASG